MKLYKSPALKPDGMYKEKVKMIVDIKAKSPTEAFVNIHHTWIYPNSGGTVNAGNIVVNDGNH